MKSIRLEKDVSSGLPPVRADRVRIVQMLSNLLSNAVKFTRNRGTIRVRAYVQGSEVHFSVADRAPGIPEDQRQHIFGRYWKGAAEAHRGVGLGLFIASGIVEAHKGRIWVESQIGVVTTFSFALPTSNAPPAIPPAGSSPPP